MSSIFAQNFSFINDDHKELSLSKEIDFKIETKTLDAWISFNKNPNDMKFLSHIYSFMNYKIPKLQNPKMLKQKRYDQKTRSGTEPSKVHNSHKHILFF